MARLTFIAIIAFVLILPLTVALALQPRTIIVHQGGDLQAAIDAAVYGDSIVVDAGATLNPKRTIVLRNKSGSGVISITTSGTLPAGVIPGAAQEPQMAKIVGAEPHGYPIMEAEADAHHYRISGLIITNAGGQLITEELVLLGARSEGGGIGVDHKPHHITFDQNWVREATNETTTPDAPTTTAIRGFDVSANFITLTNNAVGGFRSWRGLAAVSGAESSNAVLLANAKDFSAVHNRFDATFCPVFMAPAAASGNIATLSNVSFNATTNVGSATFSTTRNLAAGDLVAFKTTGGKTPTTNNSHPGETVVFQVGKVTAIAGSAVTFQGWGSYDGNLAGGNPLLQTPDSPGQAQWNGYHNENVSILRNQFSVPFNAAETIWTKSGGSPTTQPRSTQVNAGNGPKSAIEIKDCLNCVINGNTQDGWYTSFILLTPRNQGNTLTSGGAPWVGDFNIRIINNYTKRMRNWDRIYSLVIGGPQLEDNEFSCVRSGRVLIGNNLFDGGMEAILSSMGAADDVSLIGNTYPGSVNAGSSMIVLQGAPSSRFTFRGNILPNNAYGFNNQSGLQNPTPGLAQNSNVIIDNRPADGKIGDGPLNSRYPNDLIAASQSAIGWVDPASGNYRLRADSPFKGKGSDGKDPGIDMDQLLAALGDTLPTPSPFPTPLPSPTPQPSPSVSPSPLPSPVPSMSPTPLPPSSDTNGPAIVQVLDCPATDPQCVELFKTMSRQGYFCSVANGKIYCRLK